MVELVTQRDEWFPPADAAQGAFAARHRIAAALREAIAALVALDLEDVDPAPVARAEELAAALRDQLAGMPSLGRSVAYAPPPHGTLVERSPVSGRANPLAPPVHYRFEEGGVTRAWTEFSSAYEGPPGGVHGGYVAAVLDEVLGVAQIAVGTVGFTGTLKVRYVRVTPLHTRIDYEAGIAAIHGRKITIRATAKANDEVVAEAEGLFVTVAEPPEYGAGLL